MNVKKLLLNKLIECSIERNITFIWFTDGCGWNSARNNLEETFDVLDTVYNIQDLENGILQNLK